MTTTTEYSSCSCNVRRMDVSSVVFLILSHHQKDFLLDEEAQRQTWAKDLSSNGARAIWLRGSSTTKEVSYDEQTFILTVPVEDSFDNILEKTILGIKYVSERFDPEIIIRTNTSSYFDIERINRVIKSRLCGGNVLGGHYEKFSGRLKDQDFSDYTFVNGAGIFLPRFSYRSLIGCEPDTYMNFPDDVAITHFLRGKGFSTVEIKRNNLCYHHIYFPRAHVRVKGWSNRALTRERMFRVHRFVTARFLGKIVSWFALEIWEIRSVRDLNLAKVISYLRRWAAPSP